MKKRVKRKFNIKKFICFIIFLVIIYFVIDYFFSVRTKNIVVLNSNYYSDEIIIETAGIEKYPEFLKLKKNDVKNKLKKLPLINDVKISKKFGYILELDIVEKKVLYLVRSSNKYKLNTNEEYSSDDILNVPTLINFVPSDIEEEFIKELSKIDTNILNLISEIEYSVTDYDDERFILYMNDGNEVYVTNNRLHMLNKYISIMKKISSDKKGILYLDTGNYFKIKED